MKKQTFQHAELRDEHNEIIQEGTYGKYSDFSNEQNSGFIDYVMNNLEWLRRHMGGNGETNFTDYTFKIGNVTQGAEPKITSRIDGTTIFMDFVLPQGEKGEQGVKGDKGEKGEPTATIDIGTVKTIAPNEKAKIVNVGTKANVILDVYLPQGIKGEKGDTPKIDLTGLASTEYVDGRIKHVVGTAPEALDTLGEIANVLTTNKDKIGTIVSEISTKADKGTVENALMGKVDKNDVYTKGETDSKFQPKGKYVKEEDYSVDGAKLVDEFNKKANKDDVYTKSEVYTKEEANGKFQLKGNYATTDYVNKQVSDLEQTFTTGLTEEFDKKADKNGVYTKAEVDEKLKNIPKVDTSEFVKMKNGHIVLGEYEIWIER